MLSSATLAAITAATLACIVYINALTADFAFDDYFAVVRNKDVIDPDTPISALLVHDFWGQNLASSQSHKSYRPLTVLSFRLVYRIWRCRVTQPVLSWRSHLRALAPVTQLQDGNRAVEGPKDLDALPFHAANLVLHALASALVTRLAYRLFELRQSIHLYSVAQKVCSASSAQSVESSTQDKVTSTTGQPQTIIEKPQRHGKNTKEPSGSPAGPACDHASRESSSSSEAVSLYDPDGLTTPVHQLVHIHLPAWVVGIGFAVHPVHTEAVTGVVGHAELLCACFALTALMLYMHAADMDSGVPSSSNTSATKPMSLLRHCFCVAMAATLTLAAAFSKEIGITTAGCMLAYDILLQPSSAYSFPVIHNRTQYAFRESDKRETVHPHAEEQTQSGDAQAAGTDTGKRTYACVQSVLVRAITARKLWRMLFMSVCVAMYVKIRAMLAGDHLVRIYRKVENPIPFMEPPMLRALNIMQLHARYAWLLLWPQQLSADWSFECVPMIKKLWEVNNIAPLVLYAYLAITFIMATPWETPRVWLHNIAGLHSKHLPAYNHEHCVSVHSWRLFVLAGLLVGPFFPASNVLFYVGTYIGERLLYLPSVGALLLLAEGVFPCTMSYLLQLDKCNPYDGFDIHCKPTSQMLREGSDTQKEEGSGLHTGNVVKKSSHMKANRVAAGIGVALLSVSVAGLLVAGGIRTYVRNWDWLNDDTLFNAAMKVCPRSAKVQMNSGIIARRLGAFPNAIAMFEEARCIEPGYCEPTYWLGAALINQGDMSRGLTELEASLSCKYVASQALDALHTVYQTLQRASPNDPRPLARWGAILTLPHIGRVAEGCEYLEQAAMMFMQPSGKQQQPDINAALVALTTCQKALQNMQQLDFRVCEETEKPKYGGSQCSAQDTCPWLDEDNPAAVLCETLAAYYPKLTGGASRLLQECFQARLPVYEALVLHGAAAEISRAALYKYLLHVRKDAPECRFSADIWMSRATEKPWKADRSSMIWPDMHGAVKSGSNPAAHMQLVNRIQSQNADDPWLQLEWGDILSMNHERARDAALHLQVAGVLFHQSAQALANRERTAQDDISKPQHSYDSNCHLDGKPMTAIDAISVSAAAFERAVDIASRQKHDETPAVMCELLLQLIDARLGAAVLSTNAEMQMQHLSLLKANWDTVTQNLQRFDDSKTPATAAAICKAQVSAMQQRLASLGLPL